MPLAGEVEPDGTGGRLEPDPNNTRQLVLGGGWRGGVAEGVGVGGGMNEPDGTGGKVERDPNNAR